MLEALEIVRTQELNTAVVRVTVPRDEIQRAMGPAIMEVMGALASHQTAPAGPIFSRHFRLDPETFDFEVGAPVSRPIEAVGRVHMSTLPATTVARAIYRGPYEGLGAAWGEFEEWMASHRHVAADELWECYVTGPESGPDSDGWRTEFNRPLVVGPKHLQIYETPEISVTFDPNICRHSGMCVRGLRSVFDVRRRDWVHADAAPAEQVAAQIDRCPSGALQYTWKHR